MKRNRKILAGIAAAAGLCLTGLLVIQIFLVRRNLEERSQAFRQNAAGALASVVEKLEAREALQRIWTVSFMNKGGEAYAMLSDETKRPAMFALRGDAVPKVQADGDDILLTLSVPQRVRVVVVEPAGKADRILLDDSLPAGQRRIRFAAKPAGPGSPDWIKLFLDDVQYDLTLRNGRVVSILAHPTVDQSRAALIEKVLEQYLVINPVPIEQRIEAAGLRAAVEESLRERGIVERCVYGVIPAGSDKVIFASDPGHGDELLKTDFRTRLYPHDITVAAGDLAFFFPGGQGSLLARLGAPAIVAFLCILASALCLFLILRAAALQKQAAEAMSDFVANMTHEFKTPISTISLAADALGEQPVRESPER